MIHKVACLVSIAVLSAAAALGQGSKAPPFCVSAETDKLLDRWVAACDRDEEDGPELKRLLLRPDADIALLKFIDPSGRTLGPPEHNGAFWAARRELGRVNSQRTFNFFVQRLKSTDVFVREEAIDVLSEFKLRKDVAPLLMTALQRDPEKYVRRTAAESLGRMADSRSERLLINAVTNDPPVATAAAEALAKMNSKAGVAQVIRLLEGTQLDPVSLCEVLDTVGCYRRKEIVKAVLSKWQEAAQANPAPAIPGRFSLIMMGFSNGAARVYPFERDWSLREWQEWWNHVEPLLTDDLKLQGQRGRIQENSGRAPATDPAASTSD